MKIYVAAVEALKKREDRMKLTTKLVKNLVWLPVISHAKFSFPVMPLSYYAKTDHSRPLIAGLYGYSIGNGPCTLIMTTLQVSSFAKKKKKEGSLYLTTYVIHTEHAGKVLYMGLQDPCQLGKEGKNSHFFTKENTFSILMR